MVTGLRLIDPGQGDVAATLADLHGHAFDRPWNAEAFAVLLSQPGVFAIAEPDGMILCRAVLDEAEILTLAVRPDARGRGLGRRLTLAASAFAAQMGVERLFLEVAEDNVAACALYAQVGFIAEGRRRAYYSRGSGSAVDALLLVLNLTDRLPTT
ncbi:GNAT family N-acetyltransferase [soil metagenome]